MCSYFISLGNELKPEPNMSLRSKDLHFISLGNELKPELMERHGYIISHFISLGNELKPELDVEVRASDLAFYIVRKRA